MVDLMLDQKPRMGSRCGIRRMAAGVVCAGLAAVVVLWAGTAAAGERVVVLDPATSRLTFQLGGTLHDVHGSLALVRSELHVDPAGGPASGDVVLDARATETGNRSRDRKMHHDVLESERFPEIVFHLERVEGELAPDGTSDLVLAGTVKLHGDAHAFSFPARVTCKGRHLRGTAHLEIPYVDWGLEDPSFLMLRVAKQVEVELEVEGTISEPAGPPSEEPMVAGSEAEG